MNTKDKRKHLRAVPKRPAQHKKPVRKERKLKDADVVYTPPKPFKRGRFLLHLATVVAVVLAIVFGMSIFFKVEKVQVSGCSKYSAWEVSEASDVEIGSNLLTISRAQISGSIISRLPYVDSVRVGISLPDTVNIYVEEFDVSYAIEDTKGVWWLMNSDGKIVEQINGVTAKTYTQILGVRLDSPEVGMQAVAQEAKLETIPLVDEETGEDTTIITTTEPVEGITVGITGAERLHTVMTILRVLSTNSISGQINSVDVTSLSTIELWYDERFQVNLGDTVQLEYKISALKATIAQMESYESGHLDLTFTNWPDKVGYTPFT